jgi:hypothetical protein
MHLLIHNGSKNLVRIGSLPPPIRKATTGIFLWPATGLYDAIKRGEFKDNDFSHDWVPPPSGDRSRGRAATMGLQARPAARIVRILWLIPQNGNDKMLYAAISPSACRSPIGQLLVHGAWRLELDVCGV